MPTASSVWGVAFFSNNHKVNIARIALKINQINYVVTVAIKRAVWSLRDSDFYVSRVGLQTVIQTHSTIK